MLEIPGAEGGQVPLRGDSHAPGELLTEGDGGAIAERLSVSEDTVQKYAGNVSDMLWLLPSPDDHRRVLAVVACVSAQQQDTCQVYSGFWQLAVPGTPAGRLLPDRA